MTEHQHHSTGPTTPEGKRICRLNAFRHGLTGQLLVFTPGEQQAYDQHSKITLEALAPATDFERSLAQAVADDRWRLNRARAIESNLFALGLESPGPESPREDTAQVDEAFAQVRTWIQDAQNLRLLTIYEQRLQRAVDKNMAELRTVQAARLEQAREAMRQAKLLYQLDEAESIPWKPEAYFTPFPETRESVFSTPDVLRELRLSQRMSQAEKYGFSHKGPDQPIRGGRDTR